MNNGRRGEIWKGIRKDNKLKERGGREKDMRA